MDEVTCPFDYPDEDALLGPLLASGLGRHVANRAGPAAVRDAVLARLATHRTVVRRLPAGQSVPRPARRPVASRLSPAPRAEVEHQSGFFKIEG